MTDQGRRVSKNLLVKSENLNGICCSVEYDFRTAGFIVSLRFIHCLCVLVLSPTKTPKRHRAKVDISEGVSRAGGGERCLFMLSIFVLTAVVCSSPVTYAGDSSPVKTSASSLVTNVIMHINDPGTIMLMVKLLRAFSLIGTQYVCFA